MKRAALILALLAGNVHAEGWTLHTVSYHVQLPGGRDVDDLNNFNPGLGYDVTEHARIGALYNSYKKPSVYGALFLPLGERFRIGAGIISGYTFDSDTRRVKGKAAGIVPLVAAELDLTKHVSVAWFGQAFNLELKW